MEIYFIKEWCISILILIIGCTKPENKPSQLCLPGTLQNGLKAFYPFSAGSLHDYSGHIHNLTNSTSATAAVDRAGNSNCAFRFIKANGDFLNYTNPSFIDNFQYLPFSISLWYKNETSTLSNYEHLIGRDSILHCPDTYGQWSVGLYDLRRPVFGINEYSIWWGNLSEALSHDWRHLVVIFTRNNLKLYLNGVLTSDILDSGCFTNNPTINKGDLILGKEFTGLLDDVIIYNRVISQAEVTQLYNLAPCCQ